MFETKLISSYRINHHIWPRDVDELADCINETMQDISERGGAVIEQRTVEAGARGTNGGKMELVDALLYVAKFDDTTGGFRYHATVVSPHLPQEERRIEPNSSKPLDEYADEINKTYTSAASQAGRIAFYSTITLDCPPSASLHSVLLAELPK